MVPKKASCFDTADLPNAIEALLASFSHAMQADGLPLAIAGIVQPHA